MHREECRAASDRGPPRQVMGALPSDHAVSQPQSARCAVVADSFCSTAVTARIKVGG